MLIRSVHEADFTPILLKADQWWWGEHSPVSLLHRSFFRHFPRTSFVAEVDAALVGVLIGFISQADPKEAYIHLVAVDPQYRRQRIGHSLYQKFFETVSQQGCTTIGCICNPANRGSIAFHQRLSFAIQPGDGSVDGLAVTLDYAGPGQHRVLLTKSLAAAP